MQPCLVPLNASRQYLPQPPPRRHPFLGKPRQVLNLLLPLFTELLLLPSLSYITVALVCQREPTSSLPCQLAAAFALPPPSLVPILPSQECCGRPRGACQAKWRAARLPFCGRKNWGRHPPNIPLKFNLTLANRPLSCVGVEVIINKQTRLQFNIFSFVLSAPFYISPHSTMMQGRLGLLFFPVATFSSLRTTKRLSPRTRPNTTCCRGQGRQTYVVMKVSEKTNRKQEIGYAQTLGGCLSR